MKTVCIVSLACVALLASPIAYAAKPVDVLINDVTIVDVRDGKLHSHQRIAITGNRITAIGSSKNARQYVGKQTIDAHGKYAIPGLWDMHVHFGGGEKLIEENKNLLPLYVAHGITAVRDAAGDLSSSVFEWRDAVSKGELLGPRIFTSGPKIEGKDSIWPGDLEVADEQQLDAALDQLKTWNVDFIKITDNTLTTPLFLSAVRKSAQRGWKTSAHIPYSLTIDEASAAGLSSIEHIDYAFKAGSRREKELGEKIARDELSAKDAWQVWNQDFDPKYALRTYKKLAQRGTAITPTLNGSQVVAWLDQNDHKNDAYLKYIGPGLQDTYVWRVERAAKDSPAEIELRHLRFEKNAGLLPLLQQSGMLILAGTDAGFLNSYNYPGIGLHQELQLFVKYGLTPLQTLQAATINGAKFLGKQDSYGTLMAGKAADIVLLDANPLADIRATQKINTVILQGHVYDRSQLDAMLKDVADKVAEQKRTHVSEPRKQP